MESRELYTAIFKNYADELDIPNSSTHFEDVRNRMGGVIKKELTFDKENSVTMPLTKPEGYASFLADIEFKNVRFLQVQDFGGAL